VILGQVGVGTGNLCEFRFGNAHDVMLKITGVKAACGCRVVQLDKREYAAGESGGDKGDLYGREHAGCGRKTVT